MAAEIHDENHTGSHNGNSEGVAGCSRKSLVFPVRPRSLSKNLPAQLFNNVPAHFLIK